MEWRDIILVFFGKGSHEILSCEVSMKLTTVVTGQQTEFNVFSGQSSENHSHVTSLKSMAFLYDIFSKEFSIFKSSNHFVR